MYYKIVNPESGRKVSIFGKTGQQIIKNYFFFLKGGSNSSKALKKALRQAEKEGLIIQILQKLNLQYETTVNLFEVFLSIFSKKVLEALDKKTNEEIIQLVKKKIVEKLLERGFDNGLEINIGNNQNIDILLTNYFRNDYPKEKYNISILQNNIDEQARLEQEARLAEETQLEQEAIFSQEKAHTDDVSSSSQDSGISSILRDPNSKSSSSSKRVSWDENITDTSSKATQDSDNPIEIMISNYTLGKEWQTLSINEKENMLNDLQTVLYNSYDKFYKKPNLEAFISDEFILGKIPTVLPPEELKDINTLEKLRIFINDNL